MKGKTYRTLSFIVGLGTLAYMIYKIGLATIWQNIQQTGWWFIPIIGVWVVIYWLNALALREIVYEKKLPQTKVRFPAIFKITICGYAINYITPFVALGGEPYRILELKDKIGVNKATSSVLLYTIMHIFSHIVFWIVSIILVLLFIKPDTTTLITCLVTFLFFGGLVLWVFKKYKKGLLVTTFNGLGKVPGLKKWVSAFADTRRSNLEEIDGHIIELFSERNGTFYASLFFEFIARVIGCLEIYFIALALQVNVSLLDSIIVSAGSSLFANAIFFLPMQLGAREGGFVLALRSIGVFGNVGIFMSLVTRIRELVWILIGLVLTRVKTRL